MARMFPQEIPLETLEDPKRSSEIKVYNALREQLDNSYHVFYSSPWLGTNPDGSEIDGEADFLVAHAEKGILSVEVKGGLVEIDNDNKWFSTDRHKIKRSIKNPVGQALKSKHNLLKKLKESPHWKSRRIHACHGVILPHVVRPARDFRPDMPLKIFAFDEDIKHLDAWVDSRFGGGVDSGERIEPLGPDGLYALDDMISRKIVLRVRLGTNLSDDIKSIELKTIDQIQILEEMEDNNRMAIAGAAGTGKTILALEKTISMAEEKRILLLCFNRPLSKYLSESVKQYPHNTATHFHQFCRDVAKQAGFDDAALELDVCVKELEDNFIKADIEEFDAVIIDEGQDFQDDWLKALEFVVKAGDKGILYIFYDDNQNVMTNNVNYIKGLSLAKHRLTKNFRNTRRIFREAEKYYAGRSVRPIGPEGSDIIWHTVNKEMDMKERLVARVADLVQSNGIKNGDIVILCPDARLVDQFSDGSKLRVGRYPATDAESRDPDKIVVDTIRRFKGLESPVVLLVLDGSTGESNELLYTGMSRAQAILEIFAPEHVVHVLQNKQ